MSVPRKQTTVDFTGAKTAEDVFRMAKQQDPALWAEIASRNPVADSVDDDFRHAKGYRRPHRKRDAESTRYVPKDQRRLFTAEEWAETLRLRAAELREMRLTYALANELAQEGM